MPCAADPHWTAYVSALGTPIVAVVAAVLAGYFAYRQWQTARHRLRLDLFDRRFAVYHSAREFLASIVTGGVDETELFKFGTTSRDAKWLLNAAVAEYLEELRHKAIDQQVRDQEREMSSGAARNRNIQESSEFRHWLNKQYDVLDEKFTPFLKLKH